MRFFRFNWFHWIWTIYQGINRVTLVFWIFVWKGILGLYWSLPLGLSRQNSGGGGYLFPIVGKTIHRMKLPCCKFWIYHVAKITTYDNQKIQSLKQDIAVLVSYSNWKVMMGDWITEWWQLVNWKVMEWLNDEVMPIRQLKYHEGYLNVMKVNWKVTTSTWKTKWCQWVNWKSWRLREWQSCSNQSTERSWRVAEWQSGAK